MIPQKQYFRFTFSAGIALHASVKLSVEDQQRRLIPAFASTDCGFNGGEVRSPRYRKTSSDEVA